MKKNIVLTGGGTAGHVMPHIALLGQLEKSYIVHYLGSNGMEKDLLKNYKQVTYHEITCAKLIRKITPKNLTLPSKVLKGFRESKKLLKEISPSIVFSKGGFVAVPVVLAANSLGIPVISHESDITMGLANKIILRFCTVMCCSFEKTAKKHGKKCVYTGTPMRNELFNGNKNTALAQCGFKKPNKPCVLVMGGSLGAKAINNALVAALPALTQNYNIIHITGKGNQTSAKCEGYYQLEFTTEIENFFALATAVVSRAGSNSINEFLALKKPMLLIPLPKEVSRGDQIINAQEFKKHNYCLVLQQENLNRESLTNHITHLIKNQHIFEKTFSSVKVLNANNAIINLISQYEIKTLRE